MFSFNISNLLDRTKKIKNYTFNSIELSNDLSKLSFTANTQGADRIRALSNSPTNTNDPIHKSFNEFSKYYGKLN
jgi:hypothetical protein